MRRVLVTGANKGIGLAIAAEILRVADDTGVVLGSRNAERGQAALDELVEGEPSWKDRVTLLEIDVSDDGSVARAADKVKATWGASPAPLYGIVNNAGVGTATGGLASVLAVNVYGIRRVCDAFMPLLATPGGRVVNVTSAAGPNFVATCSPERQGFFTSAETTWEQLDAVMNGCIALDGKPEEFAGRGLGDGSAYGLSKACANVYTMVLARENPDLVINGCTPGFIETDMTRQYAESQGKSPAELGMKAPAEGTVSTLHLLFGELEGRGRYYGSDGKRSPLDCYRAPGTPAYTGE